MSFQSLQLSPAIIRGLEYAGYTAPTPVQSQSIPDAIAGFDLMCSAPTGTGKTAAFVLPALQRLSLPPGKGRGPRVLVLTPTRELALQITSAVEKYGRFLPRVRTGTILGGVSYGNQRLLLDAPLDILVATPGRLIDFIEQGRVDFSRLETLVLDEADRMLDMGFIRPVEKIAAATPSSRQTLLFSATLDGGIAVLARRLLRDPRLIEVKPEVARHETIEQRIHLVDDGVHKRQILDHLLRDAALDQAIVFTATKRGADRLAHTLKGSGHSTAALHGNMSQSQRNRTLDRIRSGDVRILVATDVAARGIDVLTISHVINYDLPKIAEDYVHRIGRTGRAGGTGIAISFASPEDGAQVRQIERFTGRSIRRCVIPGLEPVGPAPRSGSSSPGLSGREGTRRRSDPEGSAGPSTPRRLRPGGAASPRSFGQGGRR